MEDFRHSRKSLFNAIRLRRIASIPLTSYLLPFTFYLAKASGFRLVWPVSTSLAATMEIEFSFFSCRYLDVSVHGVYPHYTMYSCSVDRGSLCRVSPLGHPRFTGCLRLHAAFRSCLRPSSALGAKAFSLSSYFLVRSQNQRFRVGSLSPLFFD